MEPVIIEAGASSHGWSRIGSFHRCPRLYWAAYVAKKANPLVGSSTSFPLVRGIIGHSGLAQWFARLGCIQAGRNPDEFAQPQHGMERAAQRLIDGGADFEKVRSGLEAAMTGMEVHAAAHPYESETMRVRAVEFLIDTEFHGFPYTARLDLVMEDHNGARWVIDHKFVGRIEDKVFTRYSLSGQFLGMAHLAERKWGDKFAGVMLNVVGIQNKKAIRRQIEPAPFALKRFPAEIARAERAILMYGSDEDSFPMAIHEQVCTSAYGPCDMFERCRWG